MTTENTFSVGLVQSACSTDPETNILTALRGVRSAAERGAQIVCLQELFAFQYFCQSEDVQCFDLAESIPGPITDRCSALALELGVVLIVPMFEKRAPGVFHNSAVVVDANGDLLGSYRKMHIPDDPQFFEKFYFSPGDLGYRVFETQIAKLGVLICWDQWYPEAARLTALKGAELIVCPSAIGWLPEDRGEQQQMQVEAWSTVQRSHAITNGVYVAVVNRVGLEGKPETGLQFWGQSFVCDPQGCVESVGSDRNDDVIVASCSRSLLETQRRNWPFLRDPRIESYTGIRARYLEGQREGIDMVSRARGKK